MKRRCRTVDVTCLRVDGGRPFDRCRNVRLLTEVEYTEPVCDEVHASEEEGLGWLENGWNPHPSRRGYGRFQRVVSPEPATTGVAEKWVIQ